VLRSAGETSRRTSKGKEDLLFLKNEKAKRLLLNRGCGKTVAAPSVKQKFFGYFFQKSNCFLPTLYQKPPGQLPGGFILG
jgi:hypothetical protein